MTRDFKKAKSVRQYLINRYGKISRHTINDDMIFSKSICKDHSVDEIEMMHRRLTAAINIKKDTSHTSNNPITLLGIFFTVVASLMIALVSVGSNLTTMFFEKYIEVNNLQSDEIVSLIDTFDFTGIFTISLYFIVGIFMTFYVGSFIVDNLTKRTINSLYYYLLLIEEALELKELEEKNK
jgi:hypothetical protein